MRNVKETLSIFWFRRDLRLDDNAGLFHALQANYPVLCLYIFDKNQLAQLTNNQDVRVEFIYRTIIQLKQKLESLGSSLLVLDGDPLVLFSSILERFDLKAVYANNDGDSYSIERDAKINSLLAEKEIPFQLYNDRVIFDKNEVLNENNKPYQIYTAYQRKWKTLLKTAHTHPYPTENYFSNLFKVHYYPLLVLEGIGFLRSNCDFPSKEINIEQIKNYHLYRDFPAQNGTTLLGMHRSFFERINLAKLFLYTVGTLSTHNRKTIQSPI
jgi:deoxyribodipyrimidine photo-lyase